MVQPVIPPGLTPTHVLTPTDVLAGSREHSWRFEIWDRTTGYTGRDLGEVTGGNLSWQKNQAIKGRGTLNVKATNENLLNVLIRPVLTIKGWGDQPYGLWVPTFPRKAFTSASWTGTIDLVSLEAILSYTSAASVLNSADNNITVSITTGTVITDWVADTLTKAGFTNFAVQASTATENSPQSWFNGETVLQVVNDELQRLGYSSIYSDMNGTLRCDPYVLPADRPESFSQLRPFDVDGHPIFTTAFTFTDNAPNVPNRVRAVGTPVGWLPGQTAVAVNNDPDSPYSIINRGYTIEKVYSDVNTLSQSATQSYANQQLLNLSKDGRKAEIQFPHLPGLTINNVVYFNTPRAGAPMFATVDSLTVDVESTKLSGATLTAITAVQDESLT